MERNRLLEIGLDSDPCSTYLFAIRSPNTKEKVVGRLRTNVSGLNPTKSKSKNGDKA
jgi:hypothetical protein